MAEPLPEEQALHEKKLENMETEMETIMKTKVAEKEEKLKKSETDLYGTYHEMAGNLERRRLELEAERDSLMSGSINPRKAKYRDFFSLR
jgi:septin family protein